MSYQVHPKDLSNASGDIKGEMDTFTFKNITKNTEEGLAQLIKCPKLAVKRKIQ